MPPEEKIASRSNRGIIYLSIICLFLYGFVDNLKGVSLPHILTDLDINYSTGGVIQQGAYLGFLVATLTAGFLLQRYRHQKILIIATLCLTSGIIVFSISRSSPILVAAMVTIGLGLGFLDLVGIRLITDFLKNQTGRILNLTAFFHGLASMTAPLFSGYVIRNGLRWNNAYQISLVPIGMFLILVLFVQFPNRKLVFAQQISFREQIIIALQDNKAWPYYIIITSYESIEIGLAVWLNEFLLSSADLSSTLGITYLSLFFLFITFGRLVGSLIIENVGYLRLIFLSSLGVLICLILGIHGGSSFLILLPVSGFFLSTIFPTTTAAASQDIEHNIDMSLSLLLTFAGLGGMIGSWAIGWVAHLVGIRIGISFLILMALNISIIAFNIMNQKRRSQYSVNPQTEVPDG